MAEPSRQPMSAARIEQIVDATRDLFVRYGYKRTAMDDIAREAGVAKATLYAHFAGKEDVFRAMVARFRAAMNARCDAAEALDAPVDIRLAALLRANFLTSLDWYGDGTHIHELRGFIADAQAELAEIGPAFRERLRGFLVAAEATGELDPVGRGFTVDEVARTLLQAGAGAKRSRDVSPAMLADSIDLIVRLTIGSIRPF